MKLNWWTIISYSPHQFQVSEKYCFQGGSARKGQSSPPLCGKKLFWLKIILHAPKQILYNTGSWVVARWPVKRVLKLSHSFLVKDPLPLPKNGKRQICLKMLFRQFWLVSPMFFLVEKWPVLTPLYLKVPLSFLLKPSFLDVWVDRNTFSINLNI